MASPEVNLGMASPEVNRTERVAHLLADDPAVARAVAEVDRELIRAALARTPLQRVQAATRHLEALRRFKRVPPAGS